MAKFKQNNVELRDNQKIIFDSAKNKYMTYDSTDVSINTTLGGVDPTEADHLTTRNYVDSRELNDIPDVDVPSPSEGDLLTYDSTSNLWINSEAPVDSKNLNDLSDVDVPSPSEGDLLTYDSTSNLWINTDPPDPPVFGTEHGYASSEGVSTTTSGTPQEKVSLSKTGLPSGNYHIEYNVEYARDDEKNSTAEIQVQINDTTTIAEIFDETWKGDGEYQFRSGVYEGALSGDVDIDIDYWDSGGGGAGVSIRRARISIWRIS